MIRYLICWIGGINPKVQETEVMADSVADALNNWFGAKDTNKRVIAVQPISKSLAETLDDTCFENCTEEEWHLAYNVRHAMTKSNAYAVSTWENEIK